MMLPKATAELAREYDELMEKYEAYDLFFSSKPLDEITNRLNEPISLGTTYLREP